MRLIILMVLIASTVAAHSLPPRLLPTTSPPRPAHPLPSRRWNCSELDRDTSGTSCLASSPPPPRPSGGGNRPPNLRSPRSDRNGRKKGPLRRKISVGKKIGLLFVGMAAVLQVAVVGFLGFKRWQISKMKASAADSPA